jgi:perosamine synthetase
LAEQVDQKKGIEGSYGGSYAAGLGEEQLKIPYLSVGSPFGLEEAQAVIEAMQGETLTMGKFVTKFQEAFAEYIGVKHAVFVTNCTRAMEVAADCIDIKEGDEVIVPAITFVATALPALQRKAKVVFADLEYDTMNIDANSVAEKITSRTKAIFPVHHCGLPVDMDAINALAKPKGISVVEDCAHSTGATYNGKQTGGLGDAGAFSFHTIKNMTTLGEGGMFTTNNSDWAEAVRLHRFVGMKEYKDQERYWLPYHYDVVAPSRTMPASNSSMTEAQAAVGLVQLAKLDKMNARRRDIAGYWNREFAELEELGTPPTPEGRTHACHLYNLYYKKPEKKNDFMILLLDKYGVQTMIHYIPVYWLTVFQEMGYKKGSCPVAERIFAEKLDLPIYPHLTDSQVEYVASSVKAAVKELR